MVYDVIINGETHRLDLQLVEGKWVARIDEHEMEVDAAFTARDILSILVGGKAYEIKQEKSLNGETHMIVGSARYAVEVRDPRSLQTRRAASATGEGPQKLLAPMPGKVVRVLAPAGTEVDVGQGVIVVEAMKMQNELKSPKKGVVQKITAAEGSAVNSGDVLAIIE